MRDVVKSFIVFPNKKKELIKSYSWLHVRPWTPKTRNV